MGKPPYGATMWVGIDGGRPCPIAGPARGVAAHVPGGHGASRWLLSWRAARTACRRAGPGARRPHRGRRRRVACQGARPTAPPASSADRGRGPDASLPRPGVARVRGWYAHRVRADARDRVRAGCDTGHLRIARCRPRWHRATDRRGDAIPGRPVPPRPARRDMGTARAVFILRFHRHGQVGRRPGAGRPAGRDWPRPGRDLAGMVRPGWGQSGAVSCLGVPLPVRACPAPGSLGYIGAGI